MSSEPKAPLTTTTSLWPAGAILGFAALLLVVFTLINLIANRAVTKVPTTTVPVIVGGLQRMVAPPHSLTYCLKDQEVPANITGAFQFPVGTTTRPGESTPGAGAGSFDCVQPLATARADSTELINFYDAQLESRGWSLFSTGASNGDPQALFQKAGSDGFYWVVGITVTKSLGTSEQWTFTIYQNSGTI